MSDLQVAALAPVPITVFPDGKVKRADAATYLGKSSKTLAEWHRLGVGPRSFLVGGRRFYQLDDLRAYASGEKSVRPVAA